MLTSTLALMAGVTRLLSFGNKGHIPRDQEVLNSSRRYKVCPPDSILSKAPDILKWF